MTDTRCAGCGTTVQDGHPVCHRCAHALATRLARTPELVAELHTTLSRQDRMTAGRRGAEEPVPFHPAAGDALAGLATTLGGWARLLARETGHTGPEPNTQRPAGPGAGDTTRTAATTALAGATWLAAHQQQIRTHPAADEAHNHITDALDRAVRAIDRPPHRTRFPVGPCPATDPCPGTAWALIPTRDTDPALLVCNICGQAWPTESWLRVGRLMLDRAGSLNTCAQNA